MTIAVRSKGGSGGSSASAAGSGSGAGLFITAGDLLRTFFGIFCGRGARSAMSQRVGLQDSPRQHFRSSRE